MMKRGSGGARTVREAGKLWLPSGGKKLQGRMRRGQSGEQWGQDRPPAVLGLSLFSLQFLLPALLADPCGLARPPRPAPAAHPEPPSLWVCATASRDRSPVPPVPLSPLRAGRVSYLDSSHLARGQSQFNSNETAPAHQNRVKNEIIKTKLKCLVRFSLLI